MKNKYINKKIICCLVHAICLRILHVFGPGEMSRSFIDQCDEKNAMCVCRRFKGEQLLRLLGLVPWEKKSFQIWAYSLKTEYALRGGRSSL